MEYQALLHKIQINEQQPRFSKATECADDGS